jgi:hypothetical protein
MIAFYLEKLIEILQLAMSRNQLILQVCTHLRDSQAKSFCHESMLGALCEQIGDLSVSSAGLSGGGTAEAGRCAWCNNRDFHKLLSVEAQKETSACSGPKPTEPKPRNAPNGSLIRKEPSQLPMPLSCLPKPCSNLCDCCSHLFDCVSLSGHVTELLRRASCCTRTDPCGGLFISLGFHLLPANLFDSQVSHVMMFRPQVRRNAAQQWWALKSEKRPWPRSHG